VGQIILYGAISGLAVFAGAVAGVGLKVKQKVIAQMMAFAAGAMIYALSFGLVQTAFEHGGFSSVFIGTLAGAVIFVVGDYLVSRYGGRRHKRFHIDGKGDSTGLVIVMGAILDGIPEAIALGVVLSAAPASGTLVLLAIVLNNFPEGISSIVGLKKEGFDNKEIYSIWGITAIAILIVAVLSYMFLSDLRPEHLGIIEAFAAGSVLAMLADSLMPEAYKVGGYPIGLSTVLGFLAMFLVGKM